LSTAVARLVLVAALAALGLAGAPSAGVSPLMGIAAGAAAAGVGIALEVAARGVPLARLAWAGGGALGGLLAGLALGVALAPLVGEAGPVLRAGAAVLGGWVGGAVAARRAGERGATEQDPGAVPRILDSSVIVDGRIADVADAGFLDGPLLVPQFVIGELQRLADSSDTVRRARGRRAFEVLERLRRSAGARLELIDSDVPDVTEVDGKLVALARARGACLLTNDTALARVAALAGVAVGSVNDLAAALRPVALPGEGMAVQIVREGKEAGQGVGYLEDGTMVVVEGGKRFLGQPLEVVVTSMLQTSAGRMIFARPRGEEAGRDA
jgi:rRNA-processing protein FCF1